VFGGNLPAFSRGGDNDIKKATKWFLSVDETSIMGLK
jgi:hypothetical protein